MQVNAINQNLNAMLQAETQLQQSASNIADVANIIGDPQLQEVSQDLIDAITSQIPTQIAYEANANSITTQNAVQEALLNIKA